MARVFLRPAARADLEDIARYTETPGGADNATSF
jgi:plasmid stabilization system protein ParE